MQMPRATLRQMDRGGVIVSITQAGLKALLRFRRAGLVPLPTPEGEQEILRVFNERASSAAQVDEAADRLMDRCQYHPKPADVATVLGELAEKARASAEYPGLGVRCSLCGDTGWQSLEHPYSASVRVATRCACLKGAA